jgi:hypothetical protein
VKLAEAVVDSVSVTFEPEAKLALQTVETTEVQLIPAGVEVTVAPVAVGLVTEIVKPGPKAAVTDWAWFIVSTHVPMPLQAGIPPDQPVNTEVAPGVADRVTCVL